MSRGKKGERTDIHREGAFIATDYSWVFSFEAPAAMMPGFRWNCENDLAKRDQRGAIIAPGKHGETGCCLTTLREAANRGEFVAPLGLGCRCGVCGAYFKAGDVWKHNPTGELITLGHTCVDKYSMFTNRAEFLAWKKLKKAAHAAAVKAQARKNRAALWAATQPGLVEALADSPSSIAADLAHKLREYGSLSDAQVGLAFKLAAEAWTPKREAAARPKMPAPSGRVSFEARVVSVKHYDSDFSRVGVWKAVLVISGPAGEWACLCTIPSSVSLSGAELKGRTVSVTATLKPGREESFAFAKRPAWTVHEEAPATAAAEAQA